MENLIKLMIFDKSDVFNWRVLVVNWWQVTCAMLVTLWDNCLGTWNTVEGDQDKSSLDQLPFSESANGRDDLFSGVFETILRFGIVKDL